MKIIFKIKSAILFMLICMTTMGLKTELNAQQDPETKWYLQAGVGIAVWKQQQQYGFKEEGKFGTLSLEIGKKYRPLSIGAFASNVLRARFFNYQMDHRLYGVYAKYSLNRFIPILPHGVDPYLFAGSTITMTEFSKFETDDFNSKPENVQPGSKAGYSFGGGIQIGNDGLIIGLHYQFTQGNQIFDIPENPQIKINSCIHQLELKLAIRLSTPESNRRGCYSFSKKKKYLKF